MIDYTKFLEDNNQIERLLPFDFYLPYEICEDSNNIDIDIELSGYALQLIGSVTCKRTYYKGQDWEQPEEYEEEHSVELTDARIVDSDGDLVKELSNEEIKVCENKIKEFYE